MNFLKDILLSFSNNDTANTIQNINNALYTKANEYINSRKNIVANSIFNTQSDEENYT